MNKIHSRTMLLGSGFLILCLLAFSGDASAGTSSAKLGVKNNLPTTIHTPGGDKKPAVLVLHTSAGLKKTVTRYGKALSKKGFVVYVPNFFKPYGLNHANRVKTWTTHHEILRQDFLAIIETMKKNKAVDPNRIFVLGFSNGGYWATLFAAEGAITGGVSYYGAFSGGGADTDLSQLRARFNKDSSPVLILHGENDNVVDVRHAETADGLAKSAGSKSSLHIFEGADHSYNTPKKKKKKSNAKATDKSWDLTLEFLRSF
ncbi:MAG: dienelactone hydrolase family protein [Alphaproteobacteria bacterium]